MSDNSKPTQNDDLSFELTDWLDHADHLAGQATPGPWHATEPEDWHGDTGYEPQSAVVVSGSPLTWDDHSGEVFKPADAEWIAHARTALPAAVAALRAVTDLHQPRNRVTQSASGHLVDTPGPCTACDWGWPCPTTQAIQAAIGQEMMKP